MCYLSEKSAIEKVAGGELKLLFDVVVYKKVNRPIVSRLNPITVQLVDLQ
jgi:hypothetical protein